MTIERLNGTRTPGDTGDNLVFAGPCVLFGIYPELTTTGTITIREGTGGPVRHVCAIGLTQQGKEFATGNRGIFFGGGLSVQLSVATDLSMIAWAPAPG